MTLFQSLCAWLRDEKRLLSELTFGDGVYHDRPTPAIFTRADPACRRMEIRQRVEANRLRREGVGLRVPVSSAWVHDERAFRFVRRVDG